MLKACSLKLQLQYMRSHGGCGGGGGGGVLWVVLTVDLYLIVLTELVLHLSLLYRVSPPTPAQLSASS